MGTEVQRNRGYRGTVGTEVQRYNGYTGTVYSGYRGTLEQRVHRNSRYRGTIGRGETVVAEEPSVWRNRGTAVTEEQWVQRNSAW